MSNSRRKLQLYRPNTTAQPYNNFTITTLTQFNDIEDGEIFIIQKSVESTDAVDFPSLNASTSTESNLKSVICVKHGDTFTALDGASIGKSIKSSLPHIYNESEVKNLFNGWQVAAVGNKTVTSSDGKISFRYKFENGHFDIENLTHSLNVDLTPYARLGLVSDNATATTVYGIVAKEKQERVAQDNVINQTINTKIAEEVDNRNNAITAKVNTLTKADTAVAKKFVKSVSQTNGVINVERGSVEVDDTLVLGSTTNGGVSVKVNIDNQSIVIDPSSKKLKTVAKALTKKDGTAISVANDAIGIEIPTTEKVLGQSNAGLTTTLNIVRENGTGAVKETFRLVGKDGIQIGETIKIYNHQVFKSISVQGSNLVMTYTNAGGQDENVSIPLSDLVTETNYRDGLIKSGNNVSVRIASSGESAKYLTLVGGTNEKALTVSGIDSAIDTKITNRLDVLDFTKSLNDTDDVSVALTQENGLVKSLSSKVNYVTLESGKVGIPKATDVKAYVDARKQEVVALLTPINQQITSIKSDIEKINELLVKPKFHNNTGRSIQITIDGQVVTLDIGQTVRTGGTITKMPDDVVLKVYSIVQDLPYTTIDSTIVEFWTVQQHGGGVEPPHSVGTFRVLSNRNNVTDIIVADPEDNTNVLGTIPPSKGKDFVLSKDQDSFIIKLPHKINDILYDFKFLIANDNTPYKLQTLSYQFLKYDATHSYFKLTGSYGILNGNTVMLWFIKKKRGEFTVYNKTSNTAYVVGLGVPKSEISVGGNILLHVGYSIHAVEGGDLYINNNKINSLPISPIEDDLVEIRPTT